MWLFKKKQIKTLDLPPLPPMEEVSMLPEEGTIPEEIPALATDKNNSEMPLQHAASEIEVASSTKTIAQKFISASRYKGVQTEIIDLDRRFGSIGQEISEVSKIKEQRHEKIDGLQDTLEDISKKLMSVEKTLFGG